MLQTCLQRPLLPSRRPAGRTLEKGTLGPSGRKRAPNRPSEATSAEPWASWPKPGRKTLGAISAKICSKQAFRGHFRRASGRNLEKEGVGPSEREGASNIPLRGNFLAIRSTNLFIALRMNSCSSCLFCSRTLSNRCLQTQIQKTNVLIPLALSHYILPHFIPCFICTRSRKQQKHMFSPARNSAGNTRGSLSLHCSQSLRRTCPKKLFERTLFSITTFCFVTLCSTSPVQLYVRTGSQISSKNRLAQITPTGEI